MAEPKNRIQTFKDFWPYYLSEHSLPKTRWIHFAGTTVALGSVAAALITGIGWLWLIAFIGGYGPAWYGHFFVEHIRPATFTYPFWSLAADFKMWFLMLTRRL